MSKNHELLIQHLADFVQKLDGVLLGVINDMDVGGYEGDDEESQARMKCRQELVRLVKEEGMSPTEASMAMFSNPEFKSLFIPAGQRSAG